MKNVEQCQVIAIDVRESHFGLIRLLFHLIGSNESLGHFLLLNEKKEMDAANVQEEEKCWSNGNSELFTRENSKNRPFARP